jgi:hypothetical protein
MAIHKWNGHQISIQSYAVPRVLWCGLAFSVQIDGIEKYSSPKNFEGFRTVVPFKVLDKSNVINGYVESGHPCTVLHAVYRVFIGNEEVANGSVRASNWYMTYLFFGVVFAAVVLLIKNT